MRFLCLHGAGTSGAIFSAQTAAFREKLPPGQHSFDFVDAPHASSAGPGIQVFFPDQPYFTFLRSYDAAEVAQTHHWLLERLHCQPQLYDALLCFSQGCAVAASFIITHQNETPELNLPFRAVIFICGGLPLPLLADRGLFVPRLAWDLHERTARELWVQANAKQDQVLAHRTLSKSPVSHTPLAKPLVASRGDSGQNDPWALPAIDPRDAFGLDLTCLPESCRLHLPTVHIYGERDPRCPSACQLALLSNKTNRLVYNHGGAHEIPRTTLVSDAIAGAIGWLENRLARSTR